MVRKGQQIRIVVAGDFCPIGRVETAVQCGSGEVEASLGLVRRSIGENDLFIVNLECPITASEDRIEKVGPCIKGRPETLSLLDVLRVRLVTLANNHILDFGEAGLEDTIKACAEMGIETVGAGLSFDEAVSTHYSEIKGRTLAVISMAEKEFSYAGVGGCGAHPFDVIDAVERIREARMRADHVVLILHGGLESVSYPSPASVRTLRFLAEQDVTAVIRHHPHQIQGQEVWKGVPIFYSLGNFLFDWYVPVQRDAWYQGILLDLRISEDDVCTFEIHPFEQCMAGPGIRVLEGSERARFMEQYANLTRTIGDEVALRQEWRATIENRKNSYFGACVVPHPFLLRVARRLGILKFMRLPRWNRRILENYVRCDAHREVLLDLLERDRERSID